MPSKISLSICLLALAFGLANSAPHRDNYKSYNGGHNVESINTNELLDMSNWNVITDLLKREPKSHSYNGGHSAVSDNKNELTDASNWEIPTILKRDRQCHQYISSYDGGHNVYNFNKNELIDASGAVLDLETISGNGHRKFWHHVPKHCVQYIKSYNGGHNIVSYNDNSAVDLSSLTTVIDLLKREQKEPRWFKYSSYDGGHNVDSVNKNIGADVSDTLVDTELYRRNAPGFSSYYYDGGHNVESINENSLLDLSDLNIITDILKKRNYGSSHVYNGGHNVMSKNKNILTDVSDLDLVTLLRKRGVPSFASSIHARDIMEDVYKRYNNNEDCVCTKRPKAPKQFNDDCNEPKPQPQPQPQQNQPRPTCSGNQVYIDEGHNVIQKTKNSLLDLSNLNIDLDILNLGGNRDKKNVNGHATCSSKYGCCVPKDQYYYQGPSCGGDSVYINKGHNVISETKNSLLDLSNLNLDLDILSLGKSEKKNVKGNAQCNSQYGCCVPKNWYNYKGPNCGGDSVYINEGHNVIHKSKNTLLDLSNINIDLNILGLGHHDKKNVNGDAKCNSQFGCCVPKSQYYYDGGHNTVTENNNSLLDLSGLNLGLGIL